MSTSDVYSVDHAVAAGYHVTAPVPISSHLGVDGWYFRDSNWSPDFATSTLDGVQLLRQEYASAGQPVPDVHGALMFTPTFISRLLTLIGPVTIDSQTFTPDNVADKLEYEVEQGVRWRGHSVRTAQRHCRALDRHRGRPSHCAPVVVVAVALYDTHGRLCSKRGRAVEVRRQKRKRCMLTQAGREVSQWKRPTTCSWWLTQTWVRSKPTR